MTRRASFILAALAVLATPPPLHAADCEHLPAARHPRAAANANRASAGVFRDGALTLRLVIRDASWYPDGARSCALSVRAFAEEGMPATIPGPLIRARVGQDVRVTLRNGLATPVWVRGLHDRASGTLDSTELAAGATREFRFRATTPGAWYYWAGGVTARIPESNDNGQLVGALVIDTAQTKSGGKPDDRVFVMTRWTPHGTTGNSGFQVNAINGLSWPHTERLTYTMGDSVRWHVINASDELHMMHLHGFYFRVEARGDAAHDSIRARAQQIMPVTVATRRGEWMSIVWSPDRTGNWLFHCHFVTHMSADQRLDRMPGARTTTAAHTGDHATDAMAGLLLGVTVRPARTIAARTIAARLPSRAAAVRERVVHLYANTRAGVFGARPGFAFVVQEGQRPPAADSIVIPGAPLLLTRGEPTRIIVHNRLPTPLAVHWHGIELESYWDGVGGFSGTGKRVAPMIAPGGTFAARMTPPRAGTFMYHVHNEHGQELAGGLYAPLIVLEPGTTHDPRTEPVFVIATAVPVVGRGEDAPPFINGSASPDTVHMVVGATYRIRLIDISSNEAHAVSLTGPAGTATWRVVARDGRDLPSDQATPQLARENTASGVTRDFEFTPISPGFYSLAVAAVLQARPTGKVTTVPIRVRAP